MSSRRGRSEAILIDVDCLKVLSQRSLLESNWCLSALLKVDFYIIIGMVAIITFALFVIIVFAIAASDNFQNTTVVSIAIALKQLLRELRSYRADLPMISSSISSVWSS